MVTCAAQMGGALTLADLAHHRSEWVMPLAQAYRGWTIHELPPNGQGLAALMALGILNQLELAQFPVDSADSVHLQVEAMKVGFTYAHRHISDPQVVEVPVEMLLSP